MATVWRAAPEGVDHRIAGAARLRRFRAIDAICFAHRNARWLAVKPALPPKSISEDWTELLRPFKRDTPGCSVRS